MPDLVRQYRKLDDQVVTRLNRAQAQLRDESRLGHGRGSEGMCAQMWTEVMGESLWGARIAGAGTRGGK